MALQSGTRLGAYEITHALGAGGMGEVYRARDSRLGRSVAIKVILEPFGSDAERIARFEREAKVLASINHPNIAALYGMEASEGRHFLVMELVEGETLADRLQRGPMAVEDALLIGLQIAEALETAHEKGIVHRDLKPANIKITPDEKVKVLDFGLAKAMEADSAKSNVTNSPTLSMMATNAGVILGTAAYMSPEQAKGFPADHRSDIFSFGVVLYEMLTGRQPFQGETAPDILASVLVREPELQRLPPDLNPRIPELLKRCLEKSPKRRWQAIGDVRAELESIAASPRIAVSAAAAAPPKALWRRVLPVVVASLVAGGVAAAIAWRLKPAPDGDPIRFAVPMPDGQQLGSVLRQVVAIAPDGKHLVYAVPSQLHLRPMSSLTSKPIRGTELYQTVLSPVVSPDGESVAFVAVSDMTIKRISIAGGSAVTVCPVIEPPFSLTWSENTILFTQPEGIMRVPAAGGKPEKLLGVAAGERVQRVQVLPGGETVLYTVGGSSSPAPDRWAVARILSRNLKTGEEKTLVEGGSDGWYVRTGHLLYVIGGTVYAVPFDIDRVEVLGGPVPVIEGVRRSPMGAAGSAWFGIADTGTLAYVPGPTTVTSSQLDVGLIDRKGQITALELPPGHYDNPRMSPDGRRVVLRMDDGRDGAILIYDTARAGALQRFTFGGKNRFPIWTADGRRVVFQSDREGDLGIFWQPADGTLGPERLTKAAAGEAHVPEAWQPRGDVLLFSVVKGSEYSLWTYSARDRKTAAFGAVRSAVPSDAVFSPDGKWVAYSAGDTASTTVYVQPFPATGAMFQLIRRGGQPHHALWSPDGKGLIVNPRPDSLDFVRVTTQPAFAFGAAVSAPKGFITGPPSARRAYDIAPDGRIVGLIVPGEPQGSVLTNQINVVLNWFEELKARAPR